jgi:hypothetical protein
MRRDFDANLAVIGILLDKVCEDSKILPPENPAKPRGTLLKAVL